MRPRGVSRAVAWLVAPVAIGVMSGALVDSRGIAAEAATLPPAVSGQALFRTKCGVCHLEGGTGTFMLGRRLGEDDALLEKRQNLNADYIRHVVRWGIMSMPRFSRVELPDAELQAIAKYLVEPKATRPVTPAPPR